MGRRAVLAGLAVAVALALSLGVARRAAGQAMLADDIILLSKGTRAKEQARTSTRLGVTPGAGQSPLGFQAGAGGPVLGEGARSPGAMSAPTVRQEVGIVPAAEAPPGGLPPALPRSSGIAPTRRLSPAALPAYGQLSFPEAGESEGPPDGLTLDQAIERFVHANADLRVKSQELPQAEADILTAGLRANPLIFASFDGIPYGDYSTRRPGQTAYSLVLIQPLDIWGKRKARTAVAQQARRVIGVQYQDAVRLGLDNLYTAYVDVLSARDSIRYLRASLLGLDEAVRTAQALVKRGTEFSTEVDRLSIQRDTAVVELEAATAAHRQAKQSLAALLNVPDAVAERIEVRGRLLPPSPPPPPVEAMIDLALRCRPDVVAYRLGVSRAMTDLDLARADRFDDVFLLYTPYEFQNYAPQHLQSATSWGLSVFTSLPVFNRNQGNIVRAQGNIYQTQIELSGLERQVVAEVRRARIEYDTSLAAYRRIDDVTKPRAKRLLEGDRRLFELGEKTVVEFLGTRRDYNDVVRQDLDALVRLRRASLRLNTAVGRRIMP